MINLLVIFLIVLAVNAVIFYGIYELYSKLKLEKIMSRAIDWDFNWWIFGGGITLYPYQLSLGITLRYWPDVYAPTIRIHIGPVKLWLYVRLCKNKEKQQEQYDNI